MRERLPLRASVLLGIGSNLGDREGNIRRGLGLLAEAGDVEVLRVSRLIETDPVGGPPQGRYLNGAAEISTPLDPHALLERLAGVEAALGRVRGVANAPRELDLDILLYDDRVIGDAGRGDRLVVPHARMLERAFVLEVAAEIAPERVHPLSGLRLIDHWRSLGERGGMR
jgi:2-amino-4-hydroxy-6-hydroxymethyldihydropteridine diphosphokinase